MKHSVCVYLGEELGRYHFGELHPFGPQRFPAFAREFTLRQLDSNVDVLAPVMCDEAELALFHTADYIARVRALSQTGAGVLDGGDTPAFAGMYEVSRYVVGTTLDGVRRIMHGDYQYAFTPIGGLHHASRQGAAGFCIFNDCGIAIEILKREYGLQQIAYVDIDAHHGDGVFYGFEDDPTLCYVDFHEDGRYLYPGTGRLEETGTGAAVGRKLNIPMPMYANDEMFMTLWNKAEQFILQAAPEFILLQCGADSLQGDPITHLHYSTAVHSHVTQRLCEIARQLGHGRVMAMGGGGYELRNLSQAWCDVIEAMLLVKEG